MTYLEDWVFLLCPDFVSELKKSDGLIKKQKLQIYFKILQNYNGLNVDFKTYKKTQNIL